MSTAYIDFRVLTFIRLTGTCVKR